MGRFHFSTSQQVALLVAFPLMTGLLYMLLRNNSDDDDDDELEMDKLVTSRQTVIEVKVPESAVGIIIGPQGANIKQIQEACGARINFRDKTGDDASERVLIIRGSQSNAQRAEMAIHKMVADQPVMLTEMIDVPQVALGRIIGSKGDTIRQLSQMSKARIVIDRTTTRTPTKQVTLHGSAAAIEYAKGLIYEKVKEDEEKRAKDAVIAANRNSQRNTHSADSRQQVAAATNQTTDVESRWPQDYFKVYVSAVEHPCHFWVQLLNEQSPRLDQLTRQMSTYYSSDDFSQASILETISVGDIVAALFEDDNAWYRARVTDTFQDGTLDLYYVDFGDSVVVKRDYVRELRSDFLCLPFQAFECSLANITPVDTEWSESAIEMFEDLVHVAKWKVLMAKVTSYNQQSDNSLPALQLTDTNQQTDVCIASELVKTGHAVRAKDTQPCNSNEQRACTRSAFLYQSIQHGTDPQ